MNSTRRLPKADAGTAVSRSKVLVIETDVQLDVFADDFSQELLDKLTVFARHKLRQQPRKHDTIQFVPRKKKVVLKSEYPTAAKTNTIC